MILARSHPGPRPRRGFTLIEVLAAMALTSIVLPVAMRGISVCANTASDARHRAEATGLAEAKLNELIATNQFQGGVMAGDFGADWPDYHWSAELVNWSPVNAVDNGNGNTISELDLHVTWNGRGSERSLTQSTLVYTSGGQQ